MSGMSLACVAGSDAFLEGDMSGFTPGPWLFRGKSDSVYTVPTDPVYQYGDFVFKFHDEDGPNDDDLNLVLAAPDLYEALHALVNEPTKAPDFLPSRLWDAARAALAKAEGKS